MLSFDFGYLVVLGAVVVILFVYRQLDKNNRSLEKIRKFAETVRHELNTFVEERTAAVKDFETVLKVHDKTAVEILRRIQAVESNLLTRTPEIEALQARLDRYATSVADLDAQTAKVDGNLDRLKAETVFVDKVTQKIKSAGDQMTALETAFGQIRQEFADINQKDLETVRKNAVEVFERETLAYVQQLREAQKQVDGFQAFVGELESRQKEIIADTENGMRARAEAILEETEAAFKETARQADDLSSVVFLKLEERIESQAAASENRLRSELEAREASVRDGIGALQDRLGEVDSKVAEGTRELNALVESARQESQIVEARTQKDLEALQATVKGAAEQLRRDFQTEQAQLLSMTTELRSDLDTNLANIRAQSEAEAEALRVEFQSSLELDRQGARAVESRLKEDLDTLQSTIRNASEQLRRDFQTEQTQLLTMTSQLKTDLDSRLAAVSEDVLAAVELDRRNAQAAEARRHEEFESAQAAFRNATEQLRRDFEKEQEELLQKTADLKSDLVLSLAAVSTELQSSLEQERASARAGEVRTKDELEALQSLFKDGAERLQQDFAAEQERLAAMTSELKADLENRLAAVRSQSIEDAHALRAEVQTSLEATRENSQSFESLTQQKLVALDEQLSQASEQLNRSFQSEQAQLLEMADQLRSELVVKLADVRSQSVEEAEALRAELQALDALTQQKLDDLGSTLNNSAEQLRRTFLSEQSQLLGMTDQLKSDLDVRLDGVRRQNAEETQALSSEIDLTIAEVRSQSSNEADALRAEVQASLDRTRESVQGFEARTQSEMQSLQAAFDDASERLRQGFQSEQSQLVNLTTQLKADLDLRLAAVRNQAIDDADALRAELKASLEGDRQNAQLLVNAVREALDTARRETKEGEQHALDALEARLKDYETGFAYRYGKMEEAEKDLASLDTNLRQAMDRVEERIRNDFALFDQAMIARRDEEQAAVERKLETVQTSMVRLDKDLEELKTRAYDNVSEKLQGFEEEFFADLQRRNASMTQSLEDWQSSLQAQLGDLTQDAARDRAEVERLVSEALKARVQELQNTSFQQLDRLERQIQEAQETTGASVSAFRAEVDDTKTRLVDELVELERVLETRFEQDRARADLAATESLTRLERDLEAKTKLIADNFELFRADYQANQSDVQSEFGLWQAKFAQRFKELEADLDEQQRTFRTNLSENISAISDEFSRQREELVSRSAEDRLALRNDLVQIKSGIEELETALRIRSQTALDALEREYEDLSGDFQKKNRELVNDIENKIRDYRAQVVDNREGAEALHKKLVAKIEDQAGLLTVTLEEIDKRQKGFIAQTKVFERADTMKQELQEAIEDLKGDLARIEIQRKDLFEIETSVARIKKLGDETTEKVARFTADKKRIDLMDADFQRILGLSQSMEVRLEQVSNSHDLLQDIQLRIRKLEDYSKDIETRYDRLEKRREVLDTTTDGVDRNFALLEKTEKTVRGLEVELKSMPAEVEDLRKRLKVLSQGKEDADKAVERLTTLDQTLREIETRIGRMEQAREWLAGVETRLTETKAAAEEQVQTLATITKAAGGPSVKAKAADSDLRQTVLKLARQGWGKEEISRATKLSMGEVELILELGSR